MAAETTRTDEELKMAEAHKNPTANTAEKVVKEVDIDGEKVQMVFRRQPFSMGYTTNFYDELKQETTILEGDIIYERDVEIKMRDGRRIYVDIYRPVGAENLPIILNWTPFGKRHWHGAGITPGLHQAMGVPKGSISKMAPFEGADPSYWCRVGYAVVNADTPGVGNCDGDYTGFNEQYGKDGHDCVEELAKMEWCNGKIGMCGNSGLAMGQWYVAAEQPPHLACIAPWEGQSDLYRDGFRPGGIPFTIFGGMMYGAVRNDVGLVEDPVDNIRNMPTMTNYWKTRAAKLNQIKCPAYIGAGFQHPMHLRGTVEAYGRIRSRHKWIRFHREFEWPDFNNPVYREDLKLFYDRYLKEIYNGWELTPKVRIEVMDAYHYDYQTDRPENEFPLARTQYTKLYLNAEDGTMSHKEIPVESKISYDAETGEANFDMTFTEETEITGYSKLRLWVEADGNNDMDLFIYMQKLDADGNVIPTAVFGENDPGTWGKFRVSHRALDPKLSTDYHPVQSHEKEEFLSPGEIVPVDIELNVTSRIWHKGEQIRVNIAPVFVRDESWFFPTVHETNNKGRHIIHTGGKYDSYLQIPVIPPKYQVGDYVYR